MDSSSLLFSSIYYIGVGFFIYKILTVWVWKLLGRIDNVAAFAGAYLNGGAKFFSKGWGPFEEKAVACEKRLENEGMNGFPDIEEMDITKKWEDKTNGFNVLEGRFLSPIRDFLPNEGKEGLVQICEPKDFGKIWAVTIVLPFQGDEGFSFRRKAYGTPLAREGIATVMLQIPFYAKRRRQGQFKYFHQTLCDYSIGSMGCGVEGAHVARFMKKRYGEKVKIAFSGFSYGASMSSLSAAMYNGGGVRDPFALVPIVGVSSPGSLLKGVVGKMFDFKALAKDRGHNDEEKAVEEVQNVLSSFDVRKILKLQKSEGKYGRSVEGGGPIHQAINIVATSDQFVVPEAAKGLTQTLGYLTKNVEEVEIRGGHATAFMQGRWICPKYVLKALKKL